MIGRRVKSAWHGLADGEIVRWEPLGATLTDALVRDVASGSLCWYASHGLTPIDGLGPLPSRHAARERADRELLASLQASREGLIAEWHKPWPGCEHGKTIVGRSLDGAIDEVSRRIAARAAVPVSKTDHGRTAARGRRARPDHPRTK